MNVEVFPLFIREKIHAPMVSVQEREDNIVLIPIKEVASQPKKPRYGYGCMKGKMRTPDDILEPLDDFKEYM